MFDVLIRNGEIIDGTKDAKRYRGDVGIQGDRIVQIGDLRDAEAATVIDATGKIVAPGFVDTHNHSDAWLLKTPHLVSKTTQGFTTEVIMADGISYAPVDPSNIAGWIYYLRALNSLRTEEYTGWRSLADYMKLLDRRNVQNSILHIPYANVRVLAAGWGRETPDDFQMRSIRDEIEAGMEAGAVGLSTGLDYIVQHFAGTDELVEACKVMSSAQGLYVSHVRYKLGTLRGVQEAVEIGRRAGVPVHISHFKGSTQQEAEALLEYVDTIAVNEVDFSFDVYPYLPGSTMLNYLLPYEVWADGPLGVIAKLTRPEVRERFKHGLGHRGLERMHIAWVPGKENSKHQGKRLEEYAAEVGLPPADAFCNLLIEEGLAVLLVLEAGDDDLVRPFLQHDKFMIGTDGIYHEEGYIHPRQYGSAARILGPLVRDKKWFTLERAVHKLSGYPAQRFGLVKRGEIREGWYADLAIFDPETIADRATFRNPHQYSVGVEHVIVNGVPILSAGEPVPFADGPLPGRSLRFHQE